MQKNSSTSVLYGAGTTVVNIFQWTAVSRGKKSCNSFSRPFSEHYKKNGNKHVLCEIILGKTVPALAQENLIFFITGLHKILYEFSLEFDCHNILLVLSCSIALLTRQSKSTVNVQSKLSGMDAGGSSGARPRQLPCPD